MPQTMRFGSLDIDYDEQVLEPRPWTEDQARWAAELLATAPAGPVLELCAGVGHIGLLTVALAPRPLVCVDSSPVACGYARSNAARAGLPDPVEVRESRLEEALAPDERFALVIADPPWVRSEHVTAFPDDPVSAIDGGADGLDVARACLHVAAAHLVPGGSVVLQLGDAQQAAALEAQLGHALVLRETRSGDGGVLARLEAIHTPAGGVEAPDEGPSLSRVTRPSAGGRP